MKIHKILNNNFVIVKEEHEMVVMGLGIAFNKKVGDEIKEYEIEKIFYLSSTELNRRLQEVLIDVPIDVFSLAESLITHIRMELGKKVSDVIFVTLTDHINSAINRYKEGISIPNNLLIEIQKFYPQEFALGVEALKMIESKMAITLSEDEAGFIALHIVNASMDMDDHAVSYRITQLIKEILSIVRRFFMIEFDTQSLHYYRFVTHLKFFGQRLFTGDQTLSGNDVDDLLTMLQAKYASSYECTQNISTFLNKSYNITPNPEEKMYLTIHIERIVTEYRKKRGIENG